MKERLKEVLKKALAEEFGVDVEAIVKEDCDECPNKDNCEDKKRGSEVTLEEVGKLTAAEMNELGKLKVAKALVIAAKDKVEYAISEHVSLAKQSDQVAKEFWNTITKNHNLDPEDHLQIKSTTMTILREVK